jgi:hypothetical protein
MEIQTSSEAYELYRKLKDREERAFKQNRGLTLLNADEFKSSLFISVLKKVEINLLEKEEEVVVETNIFDRYRDEYNVEEFLKELKKYMSTPAYNFFIQYNRRRENKVSFYWKAKFREHDFEFEELKITIGEQAKEYVDSLGFDFVGEIKKIIKNKKQVTEKESKDFERYSFLYNRIDDLERQINKPKNSYYYSREAEDKTIKLTISYEEYNEKLKEVETEMKVLCKKYSFLELPKFDYIEIKEPIKFEDWIKEHKDEVEESWNEFDDEQKDDWEGDFDSYAQNCFETFDSDDYDSDDEEDSDEDSEE